MCSEIVSDEDDIRLMIEQILFSVPSERDDDPYLGSSIYSLIFAPNSHDLAIATQLLIQNALHKWMGDLILVENVEVEVKESQIHITIRYRIRLNQKRIITKFSKEVLKK